MAELAFVCKTIGATGTDSKRSELHTFKVMPKRWVVERFFAWLDQVPTVLEKRRAQAQFQPPIPSPPLLRLLAKKMMNRL